MYWICVSICVLNLRSICVLNLRIESTHMYPLKRDIVDKKYRENYFYLPTERKRSAVLDLHTCIHPRGTSCTTNIETTTSIYLQRERVLLYWMYIHWIYTHVCTQGGHRGQQILRELLLSTYREKEFCWIGCTYIESTDMYPFKREITNMRQLLVSTYWEK